MRTVARFPEGQRPGERLAEGLPWIFNLDLLNAYLADCEIEDAPADLSGLSWAELSALNAAYLNAAGRRPFDPRLGALGCRLGEERARRPEYEVFRRQRRVA